MCILVSEVGSERAAEQGSDLERDIGSKDLDDLVTFHEGGKAFLLLYAVFQHAGLHASVGELDANDVLDLGREQLRGGEEVTVVAVVESLGGHPGAARR